jgi:hypothetical protein
MLPFIMADRHWPEPLVFVIRSIREGFAWVSEHTLLGIPLDLPLRFLLMVGIYRCLRVRLPVRMAVLVALVILIGKELFDIVAHRNLQPRAPDWGDLVDAASGLLGLGIAMHMEHRSTRMEERKADQPTAASEEKLPGRL